MNRDGNVENRIGVEMTELDSIEEERPQRNQMREGPIRAQQNIGKE
jgi:hypothetical protein